MLVQNTPNHTPQAGIKKVNFSDVSVESIDAAARSRIEDPQGSHDQALYGLAMMNPALAAHVALRESTGNPVHALDLISILLAHAGNAALEQTLSPQAEQVR